MDNQPTESKKNKNVSFSEELQLINIPKDGLDKMEPNWKRQVKKNRTESQKKHTILKDMLEEDLSYFLSDGELDSETNKERKEELYWFLDDLNLDNKLTASILSDNDTYQSVAGLSKKSSLLGGQNSVFTPNEVEYMFDKIANWKNHDMERNGIKSSLSNGQEYLKHIKNTALQIAIKEQSQGISIS